MSQKGATIRSSRRRSAVIGVGALTLAVGITGCGPTLSMITAPWSESQAIIESTLFGKKSVTFDEPPVINVEDGRITKVTVTGPEGQRIVRDVGFVPVK